MAKILGIDFDFGGEVLTIPPLSLGDLEAFQERLGKLDLNGLAPENISTCIEITLAALKRNYPEITRERVAGLIDVGNMPDVIQSVMDVAGVRRKELAQGKAQAAQPPTAS